MTDHRTPSVPKGALAAAMRQLVGKEEPTAASADAKIPAGAGALAARMRAMIGKEA